MVRRYLGDQNYSMHTVAEADDVLDADGKVFSISGKRRKPRAIFVSDRS